MPFVPDRSTTTRSRFVPDEAAQESTQEASFLDRAVGSRTGRFALGAAGLLTGPFQLGANLGDKAADAVLGEGGFRLGDWTNNQLAKLEESKKRGMAANGDGTFDAMGIAGSMAGGATLFKGVKPAATMLGKMAQGGGIGAIAGMAAPISSNDGFWGDKATQTAVGGALGAAAPPVMAGVSKGASYVNNLLDRFTDKGISNIRGREWMQHAGDEKSQQTIINALKNPQQFVKGSNPTAAEVLAEIPEGRPIIGVQKALSTMTVGPNGKNAPTVEFGRRTQDQLAARLAAKVERNSVTDPMREGALDAANAVTQKFNDLGEEVVDRFYSKAAALQTKGQIDTLGAQADSAAKNWHQTWYPQQGNAKLAVDAGKASKDTAAIVATRQAELASAEKQLAALQATGAKPLEMRALQEKIIGLRDKPGNFSTDVVRKTMNSISEKIQNSVDKFGKLDSKELYSIRKDIGKDIEAAMGPNAKPDKKFSAMLESSIQQAIDDSIEAAGGTGWKKYLNEFSTRSKAIQADVDRSKAAKKVATEVTMGAFDNFTDQAGSGLPGLLNTKVAMANAVIRGAGKRAVPKVAAEMTADALNPPLLAAALERQIAIKGKQAATAEFISKYGRGAVQTALATQVGKE